MYIEPIYRECYPGNQLLGAFYQCLVELRLHYCHLCGPGFLLHFLNLQAVYCYSNKKLLLPKAGRKPPLL
jgi:hypothetical protein